MTGQELRGILTAHGNAVRSAIACEDFAGASAALTRYQNAIAAAARERWPIEVVRETEKSWRDLLDWARPMLSVFRENTRQELAHCAAARRYGLRGRSAPSVDMQA